MKWSKDDLKYEKFLLLDGIIAFEKKFRDKDSSQISLKDVCDFIDNYFVDPTLERLNETHTP